MTNAAQTEDDYFVAPPGEFGFNGTNNKEYRNKNKVINNYGSEILNKLIII